MVCQTIRKITACAPHYLIIFNNLTIGGRAMKRYVLTNYAIQCREELSGKVGCFIFDVGRYADEGVFYGITPVYNDLEELYNKTRPEDRKSCYVEYNS